MRIRFIYYFKYLVLLFHLDPCKGELLYPKPEELLKDMKTYPHLLIGGSATNPYEKSQAAMQHYYMGHGDPALTKILRDTKQGLQYLFQTNSSFVLPILGTGRTGMEVALLNMMEPGDGILIFKCGIWGNIAKEMADKFGGNATTIEKSDGDAFSSEEMEEAISRNRPRFVFMVMGESSTGVLQPLENIGKHCDHYNCMVIADVVAVLGICPFYFDKWGIDVAFGNSQKGIGASVGLSLMSFSDKAMNHILNRKTEVGSYIHDVKAWMDINYWWIKSEDEEFSSLHSLPLYLYYGLRESLAVIVEETLEGVWERHISTTMHFMEKVEEKLPNFKLFVQNKEYRLPGTIVLLPPKHFNPYDIQAFAKNRYDVILSTGLPRSALVGKIVRIGLFGRNARIVNADLVVQILNAFERNCTQQQDIEQHKDY